MRLFFDAMSGKSRRGPVATLVIILAVGGGVAVGTQSAAPVAIVERVKNEFNSMEVVMNKSSNPLMKAMLKKTRTKFVGMTMIFDGDNFVPTERQKNQLKKQGIEIVESGSERKFKVAGMETELSFDELMSNRSTRNRAIAGMAAYRGGTSGWFTGAMKYTLMRLGLSRNRYADFNAGEDAASRKTKYREKAQSADIEDDGARTYGEEEDGEIDDEDEDEKNLATCTDGSKSECKCTYDSGKKCSMTTKNKSDEDKINNRKDKVATKNSLVSKANKVASAAGAANIPCMFYSAFEAIQTIALAQQTLEILNLASGFMEAVDKMKAGEGGKSPVMDYMDDLYAKFTEVDEKTGKKKTTNAMQANGLAALFGVAPANMATSASVLSLNSEDLINRVNIAGIGSGTVKTEDVMEKCAYANIGSSAVDAVVTVVSGIASFFTGGGAMLAKEALGSLIQIGATAVISGVVGALAEEAAVMIAASYLTDTFGEKLGEALAAGVHKYLGSAHRGGGGTPGSKSYMSTFKKNALEMAAEKAQYERETLSPFDTSSENTFFGKIYYAAMALGMGLERPNNLTTLMARMGRLVSQSATQLLPTADAVDRTALVMQEGECPISRTADENLMLDVYCVDYELSDFSTIGPDPLEVYQTVAEILERPEMDYYGRGQFECTYTGVYSKIKLSDYKYEPIDTKLCSEYSPTGSDGTTTDSQVVFSKSYWKEVYNPIDAGYSKKDTNGKITVTDEKYWTECRHYKHWDNKDDDGNFVSRDHLWYWSYATPTNFEYQLTDYDHDCVLDPKTNSVGNPVINPYGELGTFINVCNTRTAPVGQASSEVASYMIGLDLDLGKKTGGSDTSGILGMVPVVGDVVSALDEASNLKYAKWISGVYCIASEKNARWEPAIRWYQRYVETQNWMEAAGLVDQSAAVGVLEKYYEENPLDNSYAGTLARYSGMSKEEVEETLALMDYLEWVAEYEPAGLGPMKQEEVREISLVERVEGAVGEVVMVVMRAEVEYGAVRMEFAKGGMM